MRQAKKHNRRVKAPGPSFEGTVQIEEIGAKGDGIARVEEREIFVPYTAPGDRTHIRAVGERGEIVSIEMPGPDRTEPVCPHYGQCGGCALQHMGHEFYVSWKEQTVRTALGQAGIESTQQRPIRLMPPASRRRATFYVRRHGGNDVALGFFARRSRELVEIPECKILTPPLREALPALTRLAAALPKDWPRFALAATLADNGLDIDITHTQPLTEPDPLALQDLASLLPELGVARLSLQGAVLLMLKAPLIRFDGLAVPLPPGGFLQASIDGQQALIDLVLTASDGAKKIADLFCGCGAFSLPLARHHTVYAADSDGASIEALRAAAGAHAGQLRAVQAERRNLYERPLNGHELKAFDLVVLDPPRAGAIQQVRALAASTVPRIIYVSCNPKTFARDARLLIDSGRKLVSLTPVDQFVFTPHIELVAVFTL